MNLLDEDEELKAPKSPKAPKEPMSERTREVLSLLAMYVSSIALTLLFWELYGPIWTDVASMGWVIILILLNTACLITSAIFVIVTLCCHFGDESAYKFWTSLRKGIIFFKNSCIEVFTYNPK